MITIKFPPMQKLLDYVVEKYCKLEDFCQIKAVQVDEKKCSECHQKSYFHTDIPKYKCDNFRRVYLIRYLATQVVQTSDLIENHILSDIKSKTKLFAVSLGGGPGVEVLALMDQLCKCDGKYNLTFDNIDIEASWEPIYQDLVKHFAEWVETIEITPRFYQIDITRGFPASQHDVVFVSWILSEINNKDRFGVLTKARDLARSGGYILITDRPEQALVADVTTLIKKLPGWTLIHLDPKWEKNCGLNFPPESKIFEPVPKYDCSTARWVMKKD